MIGVIGVGSFGTALAFVLANNTKDPIYVWDVDAELLETIAKKKENSKYLPNIKLPENVIPVKTLNELLEKIDDILIVVPSKFFAQLLTNIKPLIKHHRIAWATKGLDSSSLKFLHELVEEILGKEQSYAALSGPTFAIELVRKVPSAISLACNNESFSNDLVKYFNSDWFKVYPTDDIVGVQLGGIIKNIIALACGISDGLGFGANTKAAVITKGFTELLTLGEAIGAKPQTLMGLSGCGDVILTATNDLSRNRTMGLLLGQGKTVDEALKEIGQAVESLNNAKTVCQLANKYNVKLDIANEIKKILETNKISRDSIINFI